MPAIQPKSFKDLIKVFERRDFVFIRQRGDHLIYKKDGFLRPLVIPMYGSVPVFIIKNLLKTAKMSREEYLDLLSEV